MARYIDADFVTASINRILEEKKTEKETTAYFAFEQFKFLLGQAPTADVVEVVRCKDCKHWLKDVAGCTDVVGRCEYANYMVGANGYCVYGEKAAKERESE